MELLWMDERFLYALQRSEVKEEVVVEVVVVLGEDVEVEVVVLAEVGVVEVVDLAEVGVVEVDSVAEEEAEVGNLFVKLDNFLDMHSPYKVEAEEVIPAGVVAYRSIQGRRFHLGVTKTEFEL